jgi:hypothetical protein
MAEGPARASRLPAAAAFLVVLAAFALRFRDFLVGGTLYRRDAGFFFVPWRTILGRLLGAGEWPLWNDFLSGGRPLAADPNAAAFWPLTPLVLLVGTTGLSLLTLLALLALFFLGLRRLGVSPAGAAAGTLVLLFSGVFQTLPIVLTTTASAATLPLAFAELPRLGAADARTQRRALAVAAVAFALSALGGEPAITLLGAAGFGALALASADRRRALPAAAGALALALALAAVQILPTAGEVGRSARGEGLRPEHGALFWSVRPTRLLTLLEPRLTGDPLSGPFWGSGTFDAGSPYFEDLALGVLPLAFAAAAWRDRRGRAALLLAAGAALLSFGRFLPGYGLVARAAPFVRYPEKWWVLATGALAAAAAIGVDAVFSSEAEARERARRVLLRTAVGMAVVCGGLFGLCFGAEEFLRKIVWGLGLGVGEASGSDVTLVLRTPLLISTATLVLAAALFTFEGILRDPRFAMVILATLFLADAARRIAGTCPAGPADLYTRVTPEVALAKAQAADGRFYDDGADVRAVVERRAGEAGGLDLLRPATGAVFGLRYLGDNDIDRMTAAPAVRWSATLAALPWGDEKARFLREAGVSLVRTGAPAPDPVGTEEVGRLGRDRLVRISGARPEAALLPEGEGGAVTVLERRASRLRLRAEVARDDVTLWIGRTYDPNWRATLDGRPLRLRPANGYRTAATLPKGHHEVVLRYANPLFAAGSAISLLALAGTLALARVRRSG